MFRLRQLTLIGILFLASLIASALSLAQSMQANNSKKQDVPKGKSHNIASPEANARYNALLAESRRYDKQARDLLREGDYEGAEQALRKAQQKSPIINGVQRVPQTLLMTLGDIRRHQGRYAEAIQAYLPAGQNAWRTGLNLDVAVCFVYLGNYEAARRFYSDKAILEHSSIAADNLPGTHTNQALAASVLLAHGIDASLSGRHKEAVGDYEAASKFARSNALIAYSTGLSLTYLNRDKEAEGYFRKAARYGKGKLLQSARERIFD